MVQATMACAGGRSAQTSCVWPCQQQLSAAKHFLVAATLLLPLHDDGWCRYMWPNTRISVMGGDQAAGVLVQASLAPVVCCFSSCCKVQSAGQQSLAATACQEAAD